MAHDERANVCPTLSCMLANPLSLDDDDDEPQTTTKGCRSILPQLVAGFVVVPGTCVLTMALCCSWIQGLVGSVFSGWGESGKNKKHEEVGDEEEAVGLLSSHDDDIVTADDSIQDLIEPQVGLVWWYRVGSVCCEGFCPPTCVPSLWVACSTLGVCVF